MFSGTQREIQQVIKELAILFFFTRELDTETELRNKFVHRDAKCCRIFQKKNCCKMGIGSIMQRMFSLPLSHNAQAELQAMIQYRHCPYPSQSKGKLCTCEVSI